MADSTMNWTARWVAPHPDPAHCLGATVFRRTFELDAVPESLVVQVSADERYRLYVNGRLAIFGPCRGDRFFWHYEEPDLVPFLKPGRNVIHAVIWAQGSGAPLAQMSHRPGFFLQGPGMDTPNGWEGARLPGRSWRWGHPGMASTYMCVGAEESVELGIALEDLGEADLPWRTIQPFWTGRVDADEVEGPISLGSGYSFGMPEGGSHWCLTPRPIPPMVYSPWTGRLMRVDPETDARTPLDGPFTLGPGESILLDAGELLNAYPRLRFTGAGRAKVGYAEALFRVMPDGSPNWEKFDRNETVGRTFFGLEDVVSGSGIFEPLWWRCFRYLRITAESAVSVEIDSILETGYPIEAESSWESDGLDHRPIWDMCLRTVRRCAGENYFDCPYYEQLQYVGDSRIQAQIGRFLSRDRRLQRHCIESFSRSQLGNGLLQSRYPCRDFQVIPGFSLWWIHMMQDALLYDTEPLDPKWIRQADAILEWWGGALESGTDSVFWAYADWVDGWPMGEPPGRLQSMVQRLHFHWTQAVRASLTGDAALASEVRSAVAEFAQTERGTLVHPRLGEEPAGEHGAIMLRLARRECGLEPGSWQPLPEGAPTASAFYAHYLHQARPEADYEDLLSPWRTMLAQNLTTCPEIFENSRSDCHAWSAHPILGWLQRVAGIRSGGPGWSSVVVAPNPGSVTRFSAVVPHPAGDLKVSLEDGRLTVSSPVECRVEWAGPVAMV